MIEQIFDDKDTYSVESDSKIFDVTPIRPNNIYPVNLSFPTSKAYSDSTIGIIDTGASNTVISIKALYKKITDIQYYILKDAISQSNTFSKTFSSVRGKNDINGVLCRLPEIVINGYSIQDFPFYLIDDREKANALIGYDFVSSCDLIQRKDGDMKFYNFDINSMRSKMESDNSFDLLSLQDEF